MSSRSCRVDSVTIGGPAAPLCVIAGPCVLESSEVNRRIAETMAEACAGLGLPFVFKGSFDKANRSSIDSPRGPGLAAGLELLAEIRSALGVPVTTDIHEPGQAAPAASVVDLLQIPAFLCRQTDLLVACAETGRAVNLKKGQFLSPAEMSTAVAKLESAGCREIVLTERGTFFGYQRLVNDFIGLGDMMSLGPPVCFDVTHSTQLPGAGKGVTAGRPERAPLLARAAVAAGVDAIFLECHPDPPRAFSDAATVQSLESAVQVLGEVAAIRRALAGTA